jgi:N6-adenosine-specific RNA methylase IME4
MEFHSVANIFPMMSAEEFEALKVDIAANGLREPIWLHHDQIIDGRNRYRACEAVGVQPEFRRWGGQGDLASFVVSLNLKRRHLTSSQLAVVALDIEKYLAEEAKQRQLATLKRGGTGPDPQIFADREMGEAREQAAAIVGTNRQYVSDAKKIEKEAPELLSKVRAGEITIPEAKREISARHQEERREERIAKVMDPLNAIGRFPLIYADPPWKYDFSVDDADQIENHYPTMTLEEICDLPVAEAGTDDCVLLLWATSPKLEEAFAVINAWGFTYRTCAIWDKEWIGPGYYFRQRHELLLVATRGSLPVPLASNRPDSVFAERRTRHSKKPNLAYQLIERMYPELPKLELFAREARDGWSAWGNETTRKAAA